ncbi:hypothetical protein P168DRAFT_326426 [Aspergillus campestris IBT 28561]|uniref:Uncharacterized protein n=1 Tax=Aspergillus campestris (strain IBT 28561) TaxID=1392248 RepID=A0A2I1D407_ASPC2|nr:uncharacterized protein P168DRAFT_326426 [Aspergillus campestris IBT 28561]PKY04600.1 hypothetical protein P168DRAFT_326426 [Aspergillus campestris IBT 28561]
MAIAWIAHCRKSRTRTRTVPVTDGNLLTTMGDCPRQGNLLWYRSIGYKYGLQWFVPCLITAFVIAIPALIPQIAVGQAHRSGSIITFNCRLQLQFYLAFVMLDAVATLTST